MTVARSVMAQGGMRAFYAGYDSAIARQAFYTTTRFGVFLNLNDYLKQRNGGANLPVYQKMFAALAAGGIGSFVGCPADLILIRMQADTMLPEE
jgi:solute carrier family 25 oxoglutarate transporter 11